MRMQIISWNVNGIRACIKNNCLQTLERLGADVVCFQEVRTPHADLMKVMPFDGYDFWDHVDAEKKGYSGVMTISKIPFVSVAKGIGKAEFDREGRVLTTEFDDFYLINTYFPNTGEGLKRLTYKQAFNRAMLAYIKKLDKKKPVVITGDFNVAHEEIDLKNPKQNEHNAGFTKEERADFGRFIKDGFTDTFRALYPDTVKYSWWTYRFAARSRNIGWRIDYFVVSNRFMERVLDSEILDDIQGSDHCPVRLTIQ